MDKGDSKVSQGSSSLSADAAEFVPSNIHYIPAAATGVNVFKVPAYLTTCYPFVQVDQSSCNYKWQNVANSKSHSHGNFAGGKTPRGGMVPPTILQPTWTTVAPVSLQYHTMAGMPFDGGTGDGLLPTPTPYPFSYSPTPLPYRGDMYGGMRPPTPFSAQVKPGRKQGMPAFHPQDVPRYPGFVLNQSGQAKTPSNIDNPPHTIIMKDVTVQTDFAEQLAELTLTQRPNLLYLKSQCSTRNKASQPYLSSDSDVDSDSGYSSPLNRRNVISSGTHPAGSSLLDKPAFTPPVLSITPATPISSFALVPHMCAMIAQGKPSNPVHPLQSSCSSTLQPHPKKVTAEPTPLLVGVSSPSFPQNVGASVVSQHQPHSLRTVSESLKPRGYAEVLRSAPKPSVPSGQQTAFLGPTQGLKTDDLRTQRSSDSKQNCDNKLNNMFKLKVPDPVPNKTPGSDYTRSKPSGADKDLHGRPEAIADGGNEKRRRRKRNKRWNQQKSHEEGEEHTSLGSGVPRSPAEVTLHFEDEDEFPDLGSTSDLGHGPLDVGHGILSYSQALRRTEENDKHGSNVCSEDIAHETLGRQQKPSLGQKSNAPADMDIRAVISALEPQLENTSNRLSSSISLPLSNNYWTKGLSGSSNHISESKTAMSAKESKQSRKRRKRCELANQAAEAELAEIGLEQQMLLGLQSKPSAKTGHAEETGKRGGLISSESIVRESRGSQQVQPAGKKSKAPIALDIGAMIDALEKKKDHPQKEETKAAPGTKKETKARKGPNMLDTSAPLVKRGKEREVPKAKKPSPLKKVILKEREEKKKLRLLDEEATELNSDGAAAGVGVVNAESDLSQDALSSKSSQELGSGPSASADLSPVSQTSPISMSPLSPGPSPLSSGVNSPIAGAEKESNPAVLKIHSRRFREYCTQVLEREIDECCTSLLQCLVKFQDRGFHRDPSKAKSRRRIVLGLREVTKHLKLKKIKCVIISPNLEKIQSKGGLDEALNNIINMCRDQNVPFVFALGRRALGRACAKLVPVSVVGIFNYEGTETNFNQLIELTRKAREAYKDMLNAVEREIAEYPPRVHGPISGMPSLFAHMGHSRTPSGCSVISFTSSILSEPISENYPYSEPETDSKGYEIVRNPTKSAAIPIAVHEIDDGNEADTEDFGEPLPPVAVVEQAVDTGQGENDDREEDFEDEDIDYDDEDSQDASDTVEDLPHIDSIHTSSFDLSAEILSQHSARTLENSEALSTHSSRTVGDYGSTTLTPDHDRSRVESARVGMESPSAASGSTTRVRLMDKDRIQSWVDASQSLSDVAEGNGNDVSDNDSVKQVDNDDEDDNEAYESACDGEADVAFAGKEVSNLGNSVVVDSVRTSGGPEEKT